MKDTMERICKFSPFGGELVEEEVAGATSGKINPENDVEVARGADRTMFVYVPASGCPHPKQCPVLMVLRDGADRASAEGLLERLGLAALAEEHHMVVVFPNPVHGGWNFAQDPAREDDAQFIVRCFAALPRSRGGVAGFNGMIFHVATSPATSAMAFTLAATRPLDAAAVMAGSLPEGYRVPEGAGAPQVAWLYEPDAEAELYLARVNGDARETAVGEGVLCQESLAHEHVRHYLSDGGLTADEVAAAWELMFSTTRRWRNDTHGTYMPRVDFTGRGFVAHEDDTTLVSDGLPRTWYEYVPERLRGLAPDVDAPMPLVIYLHGINCIATYGAEQSGWADLADEYGFAAVFPNPTIEERWNAWDDPRLPADIPYILELIERMAVAHPIDRTRVYLSGFSMGSMFSNALACSYPEVFAGVVACNGPHMGYLQTLDEALPGMLAFRANSVLRDLEPSDGASSPTRERADAKAAARTWRMPVVQFVGLLDGVGFNPGHVWPVRGEEDGMWLPTVEYWKRLNGIAPSELDAGCATGLAGVEERTGRFIHQVWASKDAQVAAICPPAVHAGELYHLIAIERMAHAVDADAIRMGWDIVRRYRRLPDGTLGYE